MEQPDVPAESVLSDAVRRLWISRVAPETLELAEQDEIPFNTGSPPFPVSPAVKAAINASVQGVEYLGYPPTNGEASLRTVIAEFNRRYSQLPYGPDQVLVTYGAMQALYDVVAAVAGHGDEVLLPAPFWFQFPHIVAQTGATAKVVATYPGNNFKLTPKLLAAAVTPRSKLLILTTPNNPTGAVYTREELAAFAATIALFPGLLVISDEVYNLLLLDGGELRAAPSLGTFPAIRDRVLVINSLSKNQAMSGLRVGYVATTSKEWLDRATQRQRFSSLGVNVFLQAGAGVGISQSPQIVGDILRQIVPRRRQAIDLFGSIPRLRFLPPEAGYYFWVDVSGYFGCRTPDGKVVRDDVDLASYLKTSAAVAVVDGTSCGMPGYFRLTFALPETVLQEGVRRMKESLAALRCGG